MSKKTKKEKLKKEKKLNGESFIDAYFIPRAKSVRCWTRNLLNKWIRFWNIQIQFRFPDKRAEIQVWSLFGVEKSTINQQKSGEWTTCRTGGTSSLCFLGRITGGKRKEWRPLVNTSTLAWTYTGDVGVIKRNTKRWKMHMTFGQINNFHSN